MSFTHRAFPFLLLLSVGCDRYPDQMISSFFQKAQDADLQSFVDYLSPEAKEKYGNEAYLKNIADFIRENKQWDFALDSDYQYSKVNKTYYAVAYMAFLQKDQSVNWASYGLQCEKVESWFSDQPFGVECKINEIVWPLKIETSWSQARMMLYAYGCSIDRMKELLDEDMKLDPSLPVVFPGVTALSVTKERAITEIGNFPKCRETHRILKRRSI